MRCYCHIGAMDRGYTNVYHVGANPYDPRVSTLVHTMELSPSQISSLLAAKQTFESNIAKVGLNRIKIIQRIREVSSNVPP